MTARWRMRLLVTTTLLAAILAHRLSPSQAPVLVHLFLQSLHGPGFAVIALLLYWAIGTTSEGVQRYLRAGGTAVAIAVASEIAQIPGPRDAQFSDLLVDALGIAGALGVLAVINEKVTVSLTRVQRVMLAFSSLAALTAAIMPTAWFAYVLTSQRVSMPALLTFEHRFESQMYWQTEDRNPDLIPTPEDWPGDSRTALAVREDGQWGILLRIHPYSDWSGYSSLAFTAASTTGDVHEITVGIRDIPGRDVGARNPYYTNIRVGPVPQSYRIELADLLASGGETPFDLAHVEAVVLSASRPGGSVAIIVDDFRLERRE